MFICVLNYARSEDKESAKMEVLDHSWLRGLCLDEPLPTRSSNSCVCTFGCSRDQRGVPWRLLGTSSSSQRPDEQQCMLSMRTRLRGTRKEGTGVREGRTNKNSVVGVYYLQQGAMPLTSSQKPTQESSFSGSFLQAPLLSLSKLSN